MNAIDTLVEEHRLISEGLELLTTAAEKIVRGQHPPREFFESAVAFTRRYTNEYHHYKEEIVMFGLLAQKHEGAIDAEIERLRSQHEMLHNYMNEIASTLDAYSQGSDSETRRLHRNLSDYITTLRGHIAAENRIFYPMVVESLTDDEKNQLESEFEKYAANAGSGVVQDCRGLVAEMGALV